MDRRPAYYTYPQLWRLHVKDRWYLNRSHKCPVIFFSGIIKRRFVRDSITCIAACRFITQRWFWSPFSCWLLLLYAQNSCITRCVYVCSRVLISSIAFARLYSRGPYAFSLSFHHWMCYSERFLSVLLLSFPPVADILCRATRSTPAPAVATIKTSVGTYQYRGCFQWEQPTNNS